MRARDVGLQALDLLGIAEAVEQNIGAFARHGSRDGKPDARGRTSDEGSFTFESRCLHTFPP